MTNAPNYIAWLRGRAGPARLPLVFVTAIVRDAAGRVLFQRRADFGDAWWGLPGGVYMLRAIKRVHSMRLITSPWKSASMRAKTLRPAAQKESNDR